MSGNFITPFEAGFNQPGIAFHGPGIGGNGYLQIEPVKQLENTKNTDPVAVLTLGEGPVFWKIKAVLALETWVFKV